ncbi:MAG: type II toxin-antitoxin system RelE/ParE family toxin [Bacteroidales bacterium]|nr:type II toxin-antitoxin system RelE/ParE family toxin [Bacteroidales bacterium]
MRPGLLGCRKYHHIIFYRILSKNRIRIIRILHERRDFPRHL